jgi:peptidoglycan hydrolase-like protein with peptidoglycan-binding domain
MGKYSMTDFGKPSGVKAVQQALIDKGYYVGKTGADGKLGDNTRKAIIKYQKDNGIKQTGLVEPITAKSLGVQPLTSNKDKVKNIVKSDKKQTQKTSNNFSSQVSAQIDYLKENNLLGKEKFTLVDDKNSKVHAFDSNYQLYKTYDVITGKNRGDQLKTQTMTDWVVDNWQNVFSKVFDSGLQDTSNYIDNCYFGQKEWEIKNTPSGVFKRAGVIKNFMNDLLATTFIEEDYGKRFITWETCDGSTIPFGFHGTQSPKRLEVLDLKNNKNQSCTKRKMSFGCINFKESDILDINNFINSGQLSIWLPDQTNDIVKVPQGCSSYA